MSKVVGLLVAMVVSGIVTFFVSTLILMDLGSRFHGNYEYYGNQYGVLTWCPFVIGFLVPAVLFWLAGPLWRRRDKNKLGS